MNNGLMGFPQRAVAAAVQVGSTNATRVGFASSTTWTVPAGVTQVVAHLLSGGAGGSGASTNQGGGGGNGGSYLAVVLTVTPGEVLTLTVGAGGTGSGASSGAGGGRGGDSLIVRANGTVMAYCPGGFSALISVGGWWDRPLVNPDVYIANGTLVCWAKGGRGGRGHTAGPYSGGGGGGAGFGMGLGCSAQDGTPQLDVNSNTYGVGGLGSAGSVSPPVMYGAGSNPPITLSPEGGSGGSSTTSTGAAGGRAAGGSGACGNAAGGNGGNGYILLEY